MEQSAKMVSQHLNSMLEHFKVPSLIKNLNQSTSSSNSSSENSGVKNGCEKKVSNTDQGNVIESENHTNHKSVNISAENTMQNEKRNSITRIEVNSVRHLENHVSDKGQNELNIMPVLRRPSSDIRKQSCVSKPIKLKNIINKAETYDTLYNRGTEVLHCNKETCLGSMMTPNVLTTEKRRPDVILEHAKEFIDEYYASIRRSKSPAHMNRWKQIQDEVEVTGTYNLTETELIYGAKLGWRNSARCIGRIQWSKLQVFDCRFVTTTSGMFEAICNHIKYATNKGNIRSAITVFSQRTDGLHDYRIWNSQLIQYAGYRNNDGSITGDPMLVDFTELCTKLGWKSKRSEWDILPLVVSANGKDPDYFEYPEDLILQVPITHPTFDWFKDFKLRWYAVPAVANMQFDCGGIQFPGCAFNGWYMSTEIGCRNLCDTNRRNMLEPVALKMGLDIRNPTSLWKDKALVEVNIAVLHSYQRLNITLVDHHTASESFMKHVENEMKLRKGCPADWVWIVPPMSASVLPVFHQEMALYYLRPSFEYQEHPMKTHVWEKQSDCTDNRPRRKFHFKQIARAVKFTSKLFSSALSRRIKATVLYATETGKSEQYAKQLVELLGHGFNAKVYSMADYDISSIEHEALLLVVASTFGNGDPPENGEAFARELFEMKLQVNGATADTNDASVTSMSFIKVNSRKDLSTKQRMPLKSIDRLDSLRGSLAESLPSENFGPLSNIRFAVFALGSSAYPNFCSFGKYVDNILEELGGERLYELTMGDEICGQEQEFRRWAPEVFKLSCEAFCLDIDKLPMGGAALGALQSENLSLSTVRFVKTTEVLGLDTALANFHHKDIKVCTTKCKPVALHGKNCTDRNTISIQIRAQEITYQPGDHVGIFPENRKEIVDGILNRLVGVNDADEVVQLQVLKENQNPNGIFKTWEKHDKIPACSIRTLLTRFFDITSPPQRKLLTYLATCCEDDKDVQEMEKLSNDPAAYEDWRYYKFPTLLEVLEQFSSCKPPACVLLAQLTPMPPRFYSISSSPLKHPDEVHLTVAIVTYRTENGKGPEHYGVCSNYLASIDAGQKLHLFVRSAPSFHMPDSPEVPVILIGPGTGIAPFKGFWEQWGELQKLGKPVPKVYLFFGCRTKAVDLYWEEKEEMVKQGILSKVFLALSREPNVPKTYVQDIAKREADDVYQLIVEEKGHVYVCGDVTMAEHVYQTLRRIIANKEERFEIEVENIMLKLRDENRYHEDIFGITLRTAEVHKKSRATARSRMESQS